MDYSAEERYRIWLSSVEGIGSARFYRLIAECGSAKAVWDELADLSPDIVKKITARTYQNLKASRDERLIDQMLERMESTAQRLCLPIPIAIPSICRTYTTCRPCYTIRAQRR